MSLNPGFTFMANKLERFMLSFAVTPLLISSLPAIAQTSSKMPKNSMQKSMTTHQVKNVTTSPPSLPAAQTPSKSSKLSSYSPASAPMLKIGSHGKAVKDVQAFLKQQKLYTGAIDGVFGQQMRSAIVAFQQSQHLNKDGLIGQKTWAAMLKSRLG